jgi:hypothetical protein
MNRHHVDLRQGKIEVILSTVVAMQLPRYCHDGKLMLQKLSHKSKRGVHRSKKASISGCTWVGGGHT